MSFLSDMQMNNIKVDTIQMFYNWLGEGKKHSMKQNINKKSIDRVSGLLKRISG